MNDAVVTQPASVDAVEPSRDRARNRYVLGLKTAFWLGSSVLKKQRRLLPKPVERLGRRVDSRIPAVHAISRCACSPMMVRLICS